MNINIRQEEKHDYRETENVTREAFWNHFVPGCEEHYLLHIMRNSPNFVPELDLVAEADKKLVGNAVCMMAAIHCDNGKTQEVLSLGPISVLPSHQKKGIGKMLIQAVKERAREMGFKAILLCGDPEYYSKVGFIPAENRGIRTAENEYAAALQVFELQENALAEAKGRYVEDEIYFAIQPQDVEAFDQLFPPKEKQEGVQMQQRFLEVVAMRKKYEE